MGTEITMPQLGESVTEGTISKWLVRPGDVVNKYDPIAEVMTDKVNAEIPSSYSGTVKQLLVSEDDTVPVGKVICIIEANDGTQDYQLRTSNLADPSPLQIVDEKQDVSQKKRYSPAVLRIAEENNINLSEVIGTGKGGRITRKDLLSLLEGESSVLNQYTETTKVNETDSIEKQLQSSVSPSGDIEVPVTGVRKAIANNMVKSVNEAPHAWTMVEVDVTNLVKFRNEIKEEFKKKEGFNLTFLPFFIKATVEALKEFPQINSLWAGDKIIQKKDVNISIAVATDEALYVPVLKNADEKNVKGIAKELDVMVNKVRSGKITSEQMQGGTFTINNTGSFGSILSKPIINPPQAAILSVESIVKRPVVMEGDMIAIRSMVNLCLSLDHRILDGLICGRFLASIKRKLEGLSKENIQLY